MAYHKANTSVFVTYNDGKLGQLEVSFSAQAISDGSIIIFPSKHLFDAVMLGGGLLVDGNKMYIHRKSEVYVKARTYDRELVMRMNEWTHPHLVP